MNYTSILLLFMVFTLCNGRSVSDRSHESSGSENERIKKYYDNRVIYSPSRYFQASVEYSENSDDKSRTQIEEKVRELQQLPVFNRTLHFRQKDDEFECESFLGNVSMGNRTYFRFRARYDDGIKLKYETTNNGSTEETSVHFRELLVNDTSYDLRKMDMYTSCNTNSCVIKPDNNVFELVVEFSSQLFNVSFNNTVRTVFPTDVKFSINLNTTHNTNYTFFVKIDNDEDNVSKQINNTQDDDGYYFARNNSYTYTSFDRYALCDNKTIPVYMNRSDDSFAFSFVVKNGSRVYWDPMIGGTFEQLAINIDSYLPTGGSSASTVIANIMYIVVSIFAIKYIF